MEYDKHTGITIVCFDIVTPKTCKQRSVVAQPHCFVGKDLEVRYIVTTLLVTGKLSSGIDCKKEHTTPNYQKHVAVWEARHSVKALPPSFKGFSSSNLKQSIT